MAIDNRVGGATPEASVLSISGAFGLDDSLDKGDQFVVSVADMQDRKICSGIAQLTAVAFKDKLDKEGEVVGTTRIHTVSVVIQHDQEEEENE